MQGSPHSLWGRCACGGGGLSPASRAAVPRGFSPWPLGLLCPAGFRPQHRRTACVNYTLPCNLTRGLSESLKFFLIFLIIFSKTSFAQPSKCKMSEAIVQNLKNTDLPLQVKDKRVRGQVRRQLTEHRG